MLTLFHCACKLYMLKIWEDLFPGSECCVVMQISMRMQIIVDIWVLVSMMDFMPDKGENETGIFFATFMGKRCDVVALRSCWRDVTHQYKQVQNGGTETM